MRGAAARPWKSRSQSPNFFTIFAPEKKMITKNLALNIGEAALLARSLAELVTARQDAAARFQQQGARRLAAQSAAQAAALAALARRAADLAVSF